MYHGYIPVFPLLCTVLDSAVGFSQPSSCRFWYCILTWVKVSSMSTGDCLALLHDGYLFPQFRWFRVPACNIDTEISLRASATPPHQLPTPPPTKKTTLMLIKILLQTSARRQADLVYAYRKKGCGFFLVHLDSACCTNSLLKSSR